MRTLLLTCLMTGLSVFSAGTLKAQSQGEGQIAFAYADATTSIGTGKIETYHVAIRVQDDALVGTEVIGLRIPMDTKTDATDLSGWLTSELKVQSKQNVVDGQQKSVDKNNIKDGFIDLVFDTPYTLTAKGIYAGYSFTILSKDNA